MDKSKLIEIYYYIFMFLILPTKSTYVPPILYEKLIVLKKL